MAALGRGLACEAAAYDSARVIRFLAVAETAGGSDCLAQVTFQAISHATVPVNNAAEATELSYTMV